jgi:hypothetical protein
VNRIQLQTRFKPRFIQLILMVCLTAGLFSLSPAPAFADKQPLLIDVEAGFDGKMKDSVTAPVKITLTNPGDDVSGDLAVHIAHASDENDTVYMKHVDLPRNSTKTIWIAVPGMNYWKNNNVIKFYEDSIEDGNTLPFKQGSAYMNTSGLGLDAIQVGILARDPDTLNFLTLLNNQNVQVFIYPLNEQSLPNESFMLDGLDMLAINDFSSAQLSQEQVDAIKAWTDRGGQLVLAGGAGFNKSVEAFSELSPVDVSGTVSVTELSILSKNTGKALILNDPFTLSNATVTSGEVILSEGDIPLFVKSNHGQGEVWYAAYDLSLNPIASWNGNAALWTKLFVDSGNIFSMGGVKLASPPDVWEISNALDHFPSLAPPAFGVLIWVFFAYIIIAAPILYLILKKADRREWAWVLIPAVSIVSSLGIYWIGASDRNDTLAQSLNIVELNENGSGYVTRSTALFVPRGGDYEIKLPGSHQVIPLMNNYYGGSRSLSGNANLTISNTQDQTNVQFLDVPYWSIRKISAQNAMPEDWGSLSYSMEYDMNGAKGEVTNETGLDLEDVTFVMNMQHTKLGHLKAGETKAFQLSNHPTGGMQHHQFYDLANQLYPHHYPDDPVHERALMINALQQRPNAQGEVLFLALNRSSEQSIEVDGKTVKLDELNLLVQPVSVNYVSEGKAFIPYGHLTPIVTENNVDSYATYTEQSEVEIGIGELVFEYYLPRVTEVNYETLTVSNMNPSFLLVEIWNESLQSWELFSSDMENSLSSASSYVTEGGTIRMRVSNQQQMAMFRFPNISLEGTVTHD